MCQWSSAGKKVDEALGIVGRLVSKLKAQPDLGALKLGQAVEEIAKTYQAVDGTISSVLCLAIDGDALQKNSKVLRTRRGDTYENYFLLLPP